MSTSTPPQSPPTDGLNSAEAANAAARLITEQPATLTPEAIESTLGALAEHGIDSPADIAQIFGVGNEITSPDAKHPDANMDRDERRKLIEAALIAAQRKHRTIEKAVSEAMQRAASPYFLRNCPSGNSSDRCPLLKRLHYKVHYFWGNHSDQQGFGLALNGGLGGPRYQLVQGAAPPNTPMEQMHAMSLYETKSIAFELGLPHDQVVDTASNRIVVQQNTLLYCRLEEFVEYEARQRAEDKRIQGRSREQFVESINDSPASRSIRAFAEPLAELAERKAHALAGKPMVSVPAMPRTRG